MRRLAFVRVVLALLGWVVAPMAATASPIAMSDTLFSWTTDTSTGLD